MAAVVVQRRSDVPAIGAVGGHVGALLRSDVGDDSGAGRCKRSAEEIEGMVQAGVGGEQRVATRRA